MRDWGFQFTSPARLTRWINTARKQVAKQTGCLRVLVAGKTPSGASAQPGEMRPGTFAPGTADYTGFVCRENVERYAYGVANPIILAENTGYAGVYDVFGVAVSWGSARPALRWMPWDDLQAYCRSYSFIVTSYPAVWSTFGTGATGQVWLWPPPSQTLEMEWDATCLPADLNTNDDYDAIPDPLTESVKFFAAGMAMLGSFRYGQAEQLFQLYMQQLGIDAGAAEGGKVPNYYYTSRAMA
jgi:hypothetical protein